MLERSYSVERTNTSCSYGRNRSRFGRNRSGLVYNRSQESDRLETCADRLGAISARLGRSPASSRPLKAWYVSQSTIRAGGMSFMRAMLHFSPQRLLQSSAHDTLLTTACHRQPTESVIPIDPHDPQTLEPCTPRSRLKLLSTRLLVATACPLISHQLWAQNDACCPHNPGWSRDQKREAMPRSKRLCLQFPRIST